MNKGTPVGSFLVVRPSHDRRELPMSTVTIEVCDEASLQDMFESFKNFLLALGYSISPEEYIDLVSDEFDKEKYSDKVLINENTYKGEF